LLSACASSTGSPDDVLQFRGRRVKLHRIRRQIGHVERHEAGAAQAGVDFREAQQSVEYADHPVHVGDGAVDLGEGFLGGGPDQRQLFEPRAQFGQRRAQIVRNGIGHIAHAVNQ
jgi:hypothetical protein